MMAEDDCHTESYNGYNNENYNNNNPQKISTNSKNNNKTTNKDSSIEMPVEIARYIMMANNTRSGTNHNEPYCR